MGSCNCKSKKHIAVRTDAADVVYEDMMPKYETSGASGMDVRAYLKDKGTVVIMPGETKLIPTGIRVAIPEGYELQVRPRSGLAFKKSITVLNTPGTIDADYRGEIGIILINHNSQPVSIKHGERIAQLVAAEVVEVSWYYTADLDPTDRGVGGFGHTGAK